LSDTTKSWKTGLKGCKKCGKVGPFDFCSKECTEEYKKNLGEQKEPRVELSKIPEGAKQKETFFNDDLRDGAFQKGIHWRKNKIEVIFKARTARVPDNEILRQLRLGGITIQKARELMRDSDELLGRGEI
jgi:hypothetical protein